MEWYQKPVETVENELGTSAKDGLSAIKAQEILLEHGRNELRQKKKRSVFVMYLEQFKDVMVVVLLIAALISGVLLGEWVDALIIMVVVLLNALLGVIQENRAEKSLEALKRMSNPHVKVKRDGQTVVVPSPEVTVGDVVVLEAGDYVCADIRLTVCANLKVTESALTGESEPVEKSIDEITEEVPLGDQRNMAFSGSLVTYGRGEGIVVKTGMDTQIGHIAGMLDNEKGQQTPLQRRMADMSKKLAVICLGVCAVVFLVGILYGNDALAMLMTAISLAVAAIPEGLLAIVTIVLAIGVQSMISKNAIIRRLPAVETLGSATVVCSDKTGTLTMNQMTVVAGAVPFEVHDACDFVKENASVLMSTAMVLCNDGHPSTNEEGEKIYAGDPTETALLEFASGLGYEQNTLLARMPRLDELPFDSEVKRMTTVHKEGEIYRTFTKGGLDEVLGLCDRIYDGQARPITEEDKERIQHAVNEMADSALRVLAFAMGEVTELAASGDREPYESKLIFLGMVGMIDPPRPTARKAVEQCRLAGIKPVMITGDHKTTAAAIARELGILGKEDRVVTGQELSRMDDARLREEVRNIAVYARVSPEDKVRIVAAWQSYGDVVAMTGDGVNDAPALKRADIGVAMGITGTEVSKEAAAMILMDDNFATIVSAVSEGRTIYNNILKAIQFLLSCNFGEIFTVLFATLLNMGNPLLPIHILWINLITDTLPALALGVEPAEKDVMSKPPRNPKAGIFDKPMVFRIGYQGMLIGILTLIAFQIGKITSLDMGETMAFAVLAMSQIAHAINLRSNTSTIFTKGRHNKWLFFALGASVVLQLAVLLIPFLQNVFHVLPMDWVHWVIVVALGLAPIAVVELFKALGWTGEKRRKTM